MNEPKYSKREIERRWIVKQDAVESCLGEQFIEITDKYLMGTRFRLRQMKYLDGKVIFKLCKKYGNFDGTAESIVNSYLSQEEYDIFNQMESYVIQKRRYQAFDGSIDLYQIGEENIPIFEKNFDSYEEAEFYNPPDIMDREVTGVTEFSGAELAKKGKQGTILHHSNPTQTAELQLTINLLSSKDKEWVSRFVSERWGEDKVVGHNTVYQPSSLPGFVAIEGKKKRGLITYHIIDKQCEIVTIDSLLPSQGIGTALMEAVKMKAQEAGCCRLWLVTTNDNLNALRFYQKRGFSLVQINKNALETSRRLKPGIPLIGLDGIPLRDEIELEMILE